MVKKSLNFFADNFFAWKELACPQKGVYMGREKDYLGRFQKYRAVSELTADI